jgi:beta-phosphoglucomutase-like phosphatase (HAD superfamily)
MLMVMETLRQPRMRRPGWSRGRRASLLATVAGVALAALAALTGGLAAGLMTGTVMAAAGAIWSRPPGSVPARPAEPADGAPAVPIPTPHPRRRPHPDLAALAGQSWMALETADAALRAAAHHLPPEEVAARRARLAEERRRTVGELQRLAHDEHTDNPLLHWLAAPVFTRRTLGLPDGVTACVFDLDSVLTTSARIHADAWADTFDPFLLARAERGHRAYLPFDRQRDYQNHLAGRPRLDGIRAFLASRGIALPEGHADDPPGAETVRGLAKRKHEALRHRLAEEGVAAFVGSRCYLEAARILGVHRAVVTASSHTAEMLKKARLEHLIETCVDGTTIEVEHLDPKPAPDTLLAACRRLHVDPAQVADFETSLAGISAARAGGFKLAVGVDRDGEADALLASNCDRVIADLADLFPDGHMAPA